MTDVTTETALDQEAADAAEDAEATEMGRAIVLGFAIGTPVTFAVFFSLIYFVGSVELVPALLTAGWTSIVGGGFYGGVAGVLTVLNRHGH